MSERLEIYKNSQAKWWCPTCDCYRLSEEVKVKNFIDGTDWNEKDSDNEKDEDDYSFACIECNGFVRKPDFTNSKEIMINFVDGIKWDDVRKNLNTVQIDIFSLLCGKWKLGYMSQKEKIEYEKMLVTKNVNKFSEFLTRWNYTTPFTDNSQV